jgi:hypothetical protein
MKLGGDMFHCFEVELEKEQSELYQADVKGSQPAHRTDANISVVRVGAGFARENRRIFLSPNRVNGDLHPPGRFGVTGGGKQAIE